MEIMREVMILLAHLEPRLELRLKPRLRLKLLTRGNPPSHQARSWLVAASSIPRRERKRQDRRLRTPSEGMLDQVAREGQLCMASKTVDGCVAGLTVV